MSKGVSLPVAAAGSAVTISLVAGASWWAGQPLLAPPLGATALLCIVVPQAPASAPRNVVLSHAIALFCGWAALAVSGALGAPSALAAGFRPEHVLSSALALGGTVALTERLHVRHPPAGATTLIVSLGVLQQPVQFAAVVCGAALTAGCALALHRLSGVPYPAWRAAEPA